MSIKILTIKEDILSANEEKAMANRETKGKRSEQFNVAEMLGNLAKSKGDLLACGVHLKVRQASRMTQS